MHEHVAASAPHQHPPIPAQVAYAAPVPGRIGRWARSAGTRPGWLAPLAVLACLGAAFSYVLANDPTDDRRDPIGPCVFKAVTGYDCPGCGGTRMVWYLLHGNIGQAARHHLVAFVAVPVLVYAYVVWGARRLFGVRLPSRRVPTVVWAGYLAVWAVYAVLRNLPFAPFNFFFVR
jgi:hypothetical protein